MAFGPAPLPSIGLLYDPTQYEPGLFYLNGPASGAGNATLAYGRKLVAEYGSIALTGQDATLEEDAPTPLTSAAPLPSMTFLTFGTAGAYVLFHEPGTFTLTGQDAALRRGRGMTGEYGSFTLSGAPGQRDIELTAAGRLVQGVGQDATLTHAQSMTGAYGSMTLTGFDAGYVREAAGARTMSGEPGMFYFNEYYAGAGIATLTYSRALQGDTGHFTLTMRNATLSGPVWQDEPGSSGSWVYVTPAGGVWTDVDPDS